MAKLSMFAALMALAAASANAAPAPSHPQVSSTTRDASISCSKYDLNGKSGLLKYYNYDNQQINGTVLAEGAFSVISNEQGNTNLKASFYKCDQFGYVQGGSRNGHSGGMGAPIEYFGQVRIGSSCLTALYADEDETHAYRSTACANADASDEERLRQLFVLQENGFGNPDLRFLGVANTTQTPYEGTSQFWSVGQKHGAFPAPAQTSTKDSDYSLRLYQAS